MTIDVPCSEEVGKHADEVTGLRAISPSIEGADATHTPLPTHMDRTHPSFYKMQWVDEKRNSKVISSELWCGGRRVAWTAFTEGKDSKLIGWYGRILIKKGYSCPAGSVTFTTKEQAQQAIWEQLPKALGYRRPN